MFFSVTIGSIHRSWSPVGGLSIRSWPFDLSLLPWGWSRRISTALVWGLFQSTAFSRMLFGSFGPASCRYLPVCTTVHRELLSSYVHLYPHDRLAHLSCGHARTSYVVPVGIIEAGFSHVVIRKYHMLKCHVVAGPSRSCCFPVMILETSPTWVSQLVGCQPDRLNFHLCSLSDVSYLETWDQSFSNYAWHAYISSLFPCTRAGFHYYCCSWFKWNSHQIVASR